MMPVRSPLRRLAASCLLAAAAAPLGALAGPSIVPFKLDISSHEVLGVRTDCLDLYTPATPPTYFPYNAGAVTGRGVASHMGVVALEASDCVTPGLINGTNVLVFTSTRGKFTLTAANGDVMTAEYEPNTLTPTGTPYVYAIPPNTRFHITGGSGRFKGAGGEGTLTGTVNVSTGNSEYHATGTISY